MNRLFSKIFIVVCCTLWLKGTIFAGGVAQFGTVSKSKITLNPAGAAAIDRVLFDFTLFSYESENQYSPFNSQLRAAGSPGSLFHRYDYSSPFSYLQRIDSVKYEDGDVTGLHVDLAYPTTFFTVGASYDDRQEAYNKGHYVLYNGSSVYTFFEGNAIPDIESEYRRQTTSFLVAIPLKGFSIGIRQNYRDVVHSIKNLNGSYIFSKNAISVGISGDNSFSAEGLIQGKSAYQFNEYGMMFVLSGYQPEIDVGLLYRPSFETILEFRPGVVGNTLSSLTLQDLPFTEPGLRLMTVSGAIGGGRTKFNLVLEAGDFTDTERSLESVIQPGESTRDRNYDVQGYLVRLAINPFFEIAYGERSQEIAGSLTVLNTKLIKFPVPFVDGLVLTAGAQDILVKDYLDAVVAKSTSFTFSTEVKLGKPVRGPGRSGGSVTGRGLPPKTKRLPYHMEF